MLPMPMKSSTQTDGRIVSVECGYSRYNYIQVLFNVEMEIFHGIKILSIGEDTLITRGDIAIIE